MNRREKSGYGNYLRSPLDKLYLWHEVDINDVEYIIISTDNFAGSGELPRPYGPNVNEFDTMKAFIEEMKFNLPNNDPKLCTYILQVIIADLENSESDYYYYYKDEDVEEFAIALKYIKWLKNLPHYLKTKSEGPMLDFTLWSPAFDEWGKKFAEDLKSQ